jgi:hypothetical protein
VPLEKRLLYQYFISTFQKAQKIFKIGNRIIKKSRINNDFTEINIPYSKKQNYE